MFYNFISYNVDRETGLVNFEEIMKLAKKHKPKLIICGGSAYPRFIELLETRNFNLVFSNKYNVNRYRHKSIDGDTFYHRDLLFEHIN